MRGIAPEDDEMDEGGDDNDEDVDEGDEDIDWDMERFNDADGFDEGVSFGDDNDEEDDDGEEYDEDDPDATESDPDLDGRESDPGVGVETIQRLKNDLFDDDELEFEDPGTVLVVLSLLLCTY